MNWRYVSIQAPFLTKACITFVTFERFIYFMNCLYVSIQVPTLCKSYITNLAAERFLSFMNWWFSFLANIVTFERLPSYMNWNNMMIQMCFLQSLHHSCCFWKAYFLHHIYHTWMAFFPSWTDTICLLSLMFDVNVVFAIKRLLIMLQLINMNLFTLEKNLMLVVSLFVRKISGNRILEKKTWIEPFVIKSSWNKIFRSDSDKLGLSFEIEFWN
jgi:hypothetical protein